MECIDADVLVIGAGLAGLSACLRIPRGKNAVAIGKEEGSSMHAQGGIAAAIGEGDSPERHLRDTLAAGAGLCDRRAARILAKEGLERVRELVELGAPFDFENGRISLGLEGGHSARRVLHCNGDETGKRLTTFMKKLAAEKASFHRARVTSLLASKGKCFGALAESGGEATLYTARATVLATGGYAGLFKNSTNPYSLGECIFFARLAGAVLADLEFVQFHPTVAPGGFLVSESLRGEGAVLVNERGERLFPGGELLTRDVLARRIYAETAGGRRVFLDATGLGARFLKKRFPSIHAGLLEGGIDFTREPIPVEPAAHYCMGGVLTDLHARTAVTGLFACGEAACTRAHGANRLASNSLLEALVFGARAGTSAAKEKGAARGSAEFPQLHAPPREGFIESIRNILWQGAGVVRSEKRLSAAASALASLKPAGAGEDALRSLALLVVKSALARRESRGAHYREDFPEEKTRFRRHTLIRFRGKTGMR